MESSTNSTGKIRDRLQILFGIDARALGIFRIGLALALIFDLFMRLEDREMFYSDKGLLTLQEWKESFSGTGYWSLYNLFGASETWFFVLTGLAAVAYLMLLAGKYTRIAAVASYILLISAQYRNPVTIHAGEHYLRLLLLWGMLLPLGRCFSLDARALKKRNVVPRIWVADLASAGILLQVASTYLMAALLRQGPEWLQDGSALHYVFNSDQWAKPLAIGARPYPALLQIFTFFSTATHLLVPVLLFFYWHNRPFRIAGIVLAALMQISGGLFLYMGPLPIYLLLGLVLFIPRDVWDKVGLRVRHEPEPLEGGHTSTGQGNSKLVRQAVNTLALALMLYCTTLNLSMVPQYPLQVPDELQPAGLIVGATQIRPFFAPSPSHKDAWPVLGVRLRDGRDLDLLRGAVPLDTVNRAPRSEYFGNYRQFQYMQYLADTGSMQDRYRFILSFVRPWNKSHPADKDYVKQAHLALIEQTIPAPEAPRPPVRNLRILFSLFFGKQPWHERKQ